MSKTMSQMEYLHQLEGEVLLLKEQLVSKENELLLLRGHQDSSISPPGTKLSNKDIARFSRQIIMPEVGMKEKLNGKHEVTECGHLSVFCDEVLDLDPSLGQLALKKSSVLIVGAGGLGCPSALYLAGAGIGHVGIVDYDDVEINNLHRQLLHTESSIGCSKVQSAAETLKRLDSGLKVTPHHVQLNSQNALSIVKEYDVVLDATDNVATRYLLSDACVLEGRPLVSGSALKLEGQLTVYNHNGGPCYRCLFPTPPPPETITNCGDGGVLGVVPGVIGTLQALETIKIILKAKGVLSQRLLVFDGSDCTFRNVKLRDRLSQCSACGSNPTITELIDYEEFCGAKANDKDKHLNLLENQRRISATDFHALVYRNDPLLLIDVRSSMEFEICHLTNSENIPIDNFFKGEYLNALKMQIESRNCSGNAPLSVFVVCRRGNDSQRAVLKLEEKLRGLNVSIKDIVGGLHAWAREVDSTFPVY